MSRSIPGQRTAIAILLGTVDVKDRPHRLEICSRLVGRDLSSTNELSYAEAASILRHLNQLRDVGELRLLADQYRPEVTQ